MANGPPFLPHDALCGCEAETWRQVLLRELRIGIPLCLGVALFLTAVFHDPFHLNLVYSLCIGLTIQALIEAGRYALAAWMARRRPNDPAAQRPWPGWGLMGPWILVSVVLGYLAGATLAGALTDTHHLHRLMEGNLRSLAVISVVTLVVSAGTTWVFYSRAQLAATEAAAQAAQRSAAETQLMLLQSQLEPHMQFNTLANLRVLIGLDPAQAQAMLDHLIAFLRATLSASRAVQHPLAAEFERVADYLALMRVRMGERLAVELDLPDELRTLPVPPLLLQPLVENAILHGLEPQVAGGRITLRARREGAQLRLTVHDSGVGLDAARPSYGTGFGLAQVRERLATLHGAQASLTLEPAAGGGTLATLTLPITT